MTDARLAAVTVEALLSPPSDARLSAVSVEVLVPSYPLRGGWGVPINATYGSGT